jgi:hypothetical protein
VPKWMGSRHLYLDNTAPRALQDVEYQGWLKCRLLHGRGYSVLCPDLIFLDGEVLAWIQPLHFLRHRFAKDHEEVAGGLWVDISCGQTVFITFTNADLVHRYEDMADVSVVPWWRAVTTRLWFVAASRSSVSLPGRPLPAAYSCLNAFIGSTRDARRAGR